MYTKVCTYEYMYIQYNTIQSTFIMRHTHMWKGTNHKDRKGAGKEEIKLPEWGRQRKNEI